MPEAGGQDAALPCAWEHGDLELQTNPGLRSSCKIGSELPSLGVFGGIRSVKGTGGSKSDIQVGRALATMCETLS